MKQPLQILRMADLTRMQSTINCDSLIITIVRAVMSYKILARMIKHRQKSIDMASPPKPLLHKPTGHSKHTQSMHSIDPNRVSLNFPRKIKRPNRRTLFALNPSEDKITLTQRPSEQTSKKNPFSKGVLSSENKLCEKECIIKNCIAQLQGVLTQIHQTKINMQRQDLGKQDSRANEDPDRTAIVQQPCNSNFQAYVRSISNLKQDSKKIILTKRSKRKSNMSFHQIKSTLDLAPRIEQNEARRMQTLQNVGKGVSKERKKVNYERVILEVDCSAIDNVNQSSFLSDKQNRDLVAQLSGQICHQKKRMQRRKLVVKPEKRPHSKSSARQCFFQTPDLDGLNHQQITSRQGANQVRAPSDSLGSKFVKMKNNKKLMNIFPLDFF